MIIKKFITTLFIATLLLSCKSHKAGSEELPFEKQLETLFPKAQISPIRINDHFTKAFQLVLKQPLDHDNPNAGTFDHYIYVSHSIYSSPTVLVTEGYNAKHRTYELSKILTANQVMVEYRFYGKSRPKQIPWQYLKNDQAVADYHAIVSKLKLLYKNKWVSTGISKGGETVLIYKSKFPKDVDVAVPYVAPLIDTQEDVRTTNLINTNGSAACRNSIVEFQRNVLKNRVEILVMLRAYAKKRQMKFTKVSIEEALEYSVLELPFSFWQWGRQCANVPDVNADTEVLFNYLMKVSGVGLYNDKGFHHYLPSFYQHMIELGYYGFDLEPLKDLLKIVKSPSNDRFAPTRVDLTYNPEYIKKVRRYVENKGDKILYINGGYDPWGACAANPKPHVDALKMTLKGGSHNTRIKHFSPDDKRKIYAKLREWLGKNIKLRPI
jgi:hypothetical protein